MTENLIRPVHPDDAPGVVALRGVVHPYLVRGVESTRRMIAQPPPGEDWAAWVAEADGQVVGWVSAYRNIQTSAANVGEISTLHVHPAYRLRGFGTALLDAALHRHEADREAGERRRDEQRAPAPTAVCAPGRVRAVREKEIRDENVLIRPRFGVQTTH